MRKSVIVLTIIVFFACLALGIYAAEFSDINPLNTDTNSEKIAPKNQTSLLVLTFDDLSSENPVIKSGWFVVIYYPSPTGIVFQPLFEKNDPLTQNILQSYALEKNNQPSDKFIRKIQDTYSLNWDSMIQIDQSGIGTLIDWISTNNTQENSQNQIEISDYSANQVCNALTQNSKSNIEQVPWASISGNHFFTDLSFTQVMSIWQHITDSNTPVICEVFSSETN
ncbi:MAG: hypothetical protein ABFD29_11225 [Anaerolineaceae bacterium]